MRVASCIARAVITAVATLTIAAASQTAHADDLYLTDGSYTASDATYEYDSIFVGQDSDLNTGIDGTPYVATLDVVNNGIVNYAFNNSISTINVSGGLVYIAYANDASTNNVSGGTVIQSVGLKTSTTNISGGTITLAFGLEESMINISGGTMSNGILLASTTATADFTGTGLSFAYQSYGNNNPYSTYADFFKVSGNIGGSAKTYDLYIRNDDGILARQPRT